MSKLFIACLALAPSIALCQSSPSRMFKSMTAKDLNGREASLPTGLTAAPAVFVVCFGLDQHSEAARLQRMQREMKPEQPGLAVFEIQIRQVDAQEPPPAVVDPLMALVEKKDDRSKVFVGYVDKEAWAQAAGMSMAFGPYAVRVGPDGTISQMKLATDIKDANDFRAFLSSSGAPVFQVPRQDPFLSVL